jgi:hypothetical protein
MVAHKSPPTTKLYGRPEAVGRRSCGHITSGLEVFGLLAIWVRQLSPRSLNRDLTCDRGEF